MARHWVDLGAQRLHLVDLDGAKEGSPKNLESVTAILEEVNVPCELGGGIRDSETIETLLERGVARVIVGTRALKDPDWFRGMCRAFPDRLVLGIDAKDGFVATDGWLETSRVEAVDLARQFAGEPVRAINYTDIATDGMLSGPNVAAMAQMRQAIPIPVIASGGVATVEHVRALAEADVAGCIIGRALYEGTLTLPEAIDAAGA